MHHLAKFDQNPPICCGDIAFFLIFKDGGRLPSWICLGYIWTTHHGYLVVFITVQNLVAIDAVILKIYKFEFFTRLLEIAYSRPKIGAFGELDPLNGQQYK